MPPTSTREPAAPSWKEAESTSRAVLAQAQQFLEQSIDRHPALMVGLAVAAGVALGCLIKR